MVRNYEYLLAHPTLSFDPIFGYVMSKKENCLKLLQMALPQLHLVEIVDISPQKHLSLKLLEKDSRYDIWAVDNLGRKYNIEIQTTSDPKIIFRSWRYLLRLQTTVEPILKKGEKDQLTNPTYVLFFCTFDPGKEKRAKYSYSMHDDQYIEKSLENLGHMVFFNTKAPDRSMITSDMSEFLDQLDGKMKEQPNKFSIKLQDDMHEYVNAKEWKHFMNDFQLYKKEFGEEKFNEGEKHGEKRGQQSGIQKMIESYRKNFSLDNDKIFPLLKESYGSSFTDEQLMAMLNSTK